MAKRSWWAASLGVAAACGAALAQTAIPPSPKDFLVSASQCDYYETMAAHIAAVQGEDSRIRTVAAQMIRDHVRLSERLREAALASGLPLPVPGMSGDQASFLASLQSVRGKDFDKTYARQQELAHVQAAALDESFATAGADENLRTAARSALPIVEDHLAKARQLRMEIGGS